MPRLRPPRNPRPGGGGYPPAVPSIYSGATAYGIQGDAFTFKVIATGSPTSYGAGALPAGLTIDHSSGVISGTPHANGRFSVAVSATNSHGTGRGTLGIIISPHPTPPPTPTVNLPTYQVLAPGSPLPGGAVPTSGDITLAPLQSATIQVWLKVVPPNYPDVLYLSLDGLPAGVSSTISPATVTSATPATQTYSIVLTASAQIVAQTQIIFFLAAGYPGPTEVTSPTGVVSSVGPYSEVFQFLLNLVGPSITSVVPSQGAVPMLGQGGTLVTIVGQGFSPNATVAFATDTPTLPVSVAADGTSLVVAVTQTAASGPLIVVNPNGASTDNFPFPVDNYRNTRGFSWGNDGPFQSIAGAPYTDSDVISLFGAAKVVKKIGPIDLCWPARAIFEVIANLFLADGLCYGLCQTSARIAAGAYSYGSFPLQSPDPYPSGPSFSPDVWMLNGPELADTNPTPNSLVPLVHLGHLSQLSQENLDNWIAFHAGNLTMSGLKSALLSAFNAGGANGVGAMIALDPSIGTGHVMVAFAIVDNPPGNPGGYDILVYNPNAPFGLGEDNAPSTLFNAALTESTITVSSGGTWTLLNTAAIFSEPAGTPNWSGGISTLTVIPWNAVPLQPSFPWAEVLGGVAAVGGGLFIAGGGASVTQVSDGHGRHLLSGDQLNADPATRLSGVRPMPSYGGLKGRSEPLYFSKRAGALIHTVTGTGTGKYGVRALGDGYGVTLEDIPATRGSSDVVALESGSVAFTPARAKAVTATLFGMGGVSGLPRTARLKTSASAGAPVSLSFDPAAEAFVYVHSGAPARVSLRLSSPGSRGKAAMYQVRAVPASDGDKVTFAPDWNRLALGKGTIVMHAAGVKTPTQRPLGAAT